MLEIVKLLATLVGGGLAGALFTEWFRRRRSKVRQIPLIERVNRLVSPELQGITLARIVGTSANRQLEELKNLREYQLTMRNTSPIHLQDAEVQFEFPAEDVQAWASRPSLSKTALVEEDAGATAPWKKAFRWRIPHLPSGDSVEFTFRAVDPSSDDYEAALYRSEGVVLERIIGEPPPRKRTSVSDLIMYICLAVVLSASVVFYFVERQEDRTIASLINSLPGRSERKSLDERVNPIRLAGCNLIVISSADGSGGRWLITSRVINLGVQACGMRPKNGESIGPDTIPANATSKRESFSEKQPQLVDEEISVHSANSSPATTTVPIYVVPE
jgi:hypothetical protein